MADRSQLKSLSLSAKILVTCFLVTLGVGYFVAILQVQNRTEFKAANTIVHFRGDASDAEMHPPQSYATLLSVAHVHSLSQPVMLALVGLLFVLTGYSERSKIVWILASFGGSLLGNAGPWLIRYASPSFVFLLSISGMALIGSFFGMAILILKDVWIKK